MSDGLLIPLDRGNGGAVINPDLDAHAQRIRDLVNVARGCIIEIGRELIEAKTMIGHGGWLPWLDREFGWSDETARKYMRVAEAFQIPTRLGFEGLTIDATALYYLSAPSVPDAVREEVIEQAETGKRITIEEAERMVADRVAKEIEEVRAALRQQQEQASSTDEAPPPEPTINDAIALMCKLTGRKKLTPRQMQSLAHAMQKTVQYGGAIYAPVSDEDARKADLAVKVTSDLMRALAFFEGEAMPPARLIELAPDYVRANLERMVPKAREWLDECDRQLGEKGHGEGGRRKRQT